MSSRLDFSDIHSEIFQSVHGWAQKNLAPGAAERDRNATFDPILYQKLDTELGIMNITLPEFLNGAGLDIAATIHAIEALSTADPGIAISYLSQELLFTHQLYWTWKSDNAQIPQEHADILKKKPISGMAMTEPEAGTDVLGMKTRADITENGFTLHGVKQWITNGTIGEYFLVYARTGDDRRDISLFLVHAHTPGLTRQTCDDKMGMRSSPTGILTFQNCQIPKWALVGTLHQGLKPMIRNLAVERLGLAAQSCGIASACLDIMKTYAAQRQAFGKSIAQFGQIQSYIANSYAALHAMRAFLYETVWKLLENAPDASLAADAVKLFCAKSAEDISRHAIQILGANGYSSAYPVERLHRDAILLSIGGGTNEALEKNITKLLTRHS